MLGRYVNAFVETSFPTVLLYLLAFVGPHIYRVSPNEIDLLNILGPPNRDHLLGTDDNGRDILARLLNGGQVSLIVGLVAVLIADTVGVLTGAFSGYFGKALDSVLMPSNTWRPVVAAE